MATRRKGLAFIGLGIVVVLATIVAGWSLQGGRTGFGPFQFFGIEVGIFLSLIGMGFLLLKPDDKVSLWKQFYALIEKILDWPKAVWVILAFLLLYVPFFLFPLFFAKNQIHYLTKYIPDAYITHIGFDIEAIVSRIQAWFVTGQSPYADGFIAYPPLAIALFAPLILIGYPAYFKLMTGLTLIAYLIAVWLIPSLVIPKDKRAILFLIFITGLFSYGLQFEVERGQFNLVVFSLCLFAIYLFHYYPRFRYFAYVLFSLAVQLKVYPVIFVVMFIENWKDWKSNITRLLGLGLLNFSLLFILGYPFFQDFLQAITAYQFDYQSSRYENLSIKAFAYYFSTNLFDASIASKASVWLEIFFFLLVGLSLWVTILVAWKKDMHGLNPCLLLVSTLAALIIPSVSNDYKLSILIAPVILFLSQETEIHVKSKKIIYIVLTFLTSLAYWSTFYPATVKPDFLDRNFPALFLMLMSVTVLNFLVPYTETIATNHSHR